MAWTRERGRKHTGGFAEVGMESKLTVLPLSLIKEATINKITTEILDTNINIRLLNF